MLAVHSLASLVKKQGQTDGQTDRYISHYRMTTQIEVDIVIHIDKYRSKHTCSWENVQSKIIGVCKRTQTDGKYMSRKNMRRKNENYTFE